MNQVPQAIEAEQAVLGAVMVTGRDGFDQASVILSEPHFFRQDHQLIYRAITALAKHQRRFDPLTLGDWLHSKGYDEDRRLSDYLIHISRSFPSAANLKAYAEIVRDKALLREIVQLGTEIIDLGMNPRGSALDAAGRVQSLPSRLLEDQPSESSPIGPIIEAAFHDLDEFQMQGGGMDGLPTGFTDYDEILGGLVPGLHVFAGRPKHGKSTLAQNVAEYCALLMQKPVHVTLLEMTTKQFGNRLIASVGGVSASRMRRGELDDADWSSASAAVRKLKAAPIFITKPRRATIEQVCAQIRKQHADTPLGLAVVDYLQLIAVVVGRGENYSVAIGHITKALVDLAHELVIPIILISQLNRDVEKRPNKRPQMSDLRDSGSIEADAESITFVYRDEMYDPKSQWIGTMEVIVAANRNGPPGDCRLLYEGAHYRCSNLPIGWEPAAKPEKAPRARSNTFKQKATGSRGKDKDE